MVPAKYWQATRSYSLPASVIPVLLGTVLAATGYAAPRVFHWQTFVLTLVGAVLAHFGGNVLNDFYDYRYGIDTKPEHGSGVLTQGLLTTRQMLTFGIVLMAGAALCGLALLKNHTGVVIPLALLGLACAVLYPAILKRYALGDLMIILAFGIGLTVGAYGVEVGSLSIRQWELITLLAVPVSLLVDAILHANNLRDRDDDHDAKVRTLATLLPPAAAQRLQQFLLFGPVALALLGIPFGLVPLGALVTLLAIPILLRAYRTGSVPGTAQAHLVFGLLYTVGFVLGPHH